VSGVGGLTSCPEKRGFGVEERFYCAVVAMCVGLFAVVVFPLRFVCCRGNLE
jgi:hypothetical protein